VLNNDNNDNEVIWCLCLSGCWGSANCFVPAQHSALLRHVTHYS